jgi:hypothetical protein
MVSVRMQVVIRERLTVVEYKCSIHTNSGEEGEKGGERNYGSIEEGGWETTKK